MKNVMTSAFVAVLTAVAIAPPAARAQNQVGLQIIEETNGGVETARAVWSSDPAAFISVTRSTATPESWLIDLSKSGHATLGGGNFPGQNNVMTWFEPEHPGLYNNLFYIDDLHWRLDSEQPIPANTFNEGFGIFGNGTSIFAGQDFNGDSVFASVTERQIPEPASLALLGVGLAGLGLHRKNRS